MTSVTQRLTSDQILALAPDSSSAKAGTALANGRQWSALGANETAAWGECQGSGKLPYQARIDLREAAFKCTCPSRKFPCKHGLGLYLLLASDPGLFSGGDAPAWVTEWLTSRAERTERKQQREAAPDPEAQAKRAAAREAKVASGLDELELWMRDLVRMGIAGLPGKDYGFWDAPAARLVDAQAPGVARMVRELAGIPATGAGWQDHFLERLGLLTLLIEGYRRGTELPEATRADLRAVIGFTAAQDELLIQAGVTDEWQVVGRCVEVEDRLRVQRSWLLGKKSGQAALVLHFGAGTEPLDTSLPTGAAFRGELVFYPSARPQRALIKSREPAATFHPAGMSLDQAHAEYRQALSRCPWTERYPMLIAGSIPRHLGGDFRLLDEEGRELPLRGSPQSLWKLVAVSGGRPLAVFGEWDGCGLRPVTTWSESGTVILESAI